MRFFPDLARHDRADPPGAESDAAFPPARERLGDTATTLAEVSREMVQWVPVLRRLAEAEQLRDLALGHSSELSAAAVRSIINARRLRDQYFWPAMNEAAWALLLELFANRLEGERLDATGLAMATGLPFDSALHWLDWLTGRAMIMRGEAADAASAPVALTEAAADEMRAYLLAALRLSPWVQ
jgi:hypothetical protein